MNNKTKAILTAIFMFPFMFLVNLIGVLSGLIITFFLVTYCLAFNKQKFPKLFWLWDNDEDGFTGNQRWHWWDNYLDKGLKPVSEREWYGRRDLSWIKRWWRSYHWSAIRNPFNNLHRSWLSWETTNPEWVQVEKTKSGGYVIYVKPRGSKLYHISIKQPKYWLGLKVKPEYFDKGCDIDEYHTTHSYTFRK